MLTGLATGAVIFAAVFGAQIAWYVIRDWKAGRRVITTTQAEDQAMALGNGKLPAAARTAPAPAQPLRPGVPPPGHRAALDMAPPHGRCTWCGWHRVYRPCCGWLWVPEICPAHQTRRTTP